MHFSMSSSAASAWPVEYAYQACMYAKADVPRVSDGARPSQVSTAARASRYSVALISLRIVALETPRPAATRFRVEMMRGASCPTCGLNPAPRQAVMIVS